MLAPERILRTLAETVAKMELVVTAIKVIPVETAVKKVHVHLAEVLVAVQMIAMELAATKGGAYEKTFIL